MTTEPSKLEFSLKIRSNGLSHNTEVVVVDPSGNEHPLVGVTKITWLAEAKQPVVRCTIEVDKAVLEAKTEAVIYEYIDKLAFKPSEVVLHVPGDYTDV